jgi:Uma2 family endonuclease
MTTLFLERVETAEHRVLWHAERPITFAEFLEMPERQEQQELAGGVIVEKEMVPLDHEKLLLWLVRLVGSYAEARQLGLILGSRTLVATGLFGGRLPDMVFVRADNLGIVGQKAITDTPDLILEIVSPNDRPYHLVALETEYRSLSVPEIIFLDQQKRQVRTVRLREGGYEEEVFSEGALVLERIGELTLPLRWLFEEPRPEVFATLRTLLPDTPALP